jgi:hypothetical protein
MDRREILKAAGVLLGVAISPSCSRALESGEDLNAAPASGELLADAQRIIEVLADLIIPETDTPGAIEAGVPQFIHQIVMDWYTAAERTIFLDGLAALDATSRSNWSLSFVELEPAQQAQLLAALEPVRGPQTQGGDALTAIFMPAGAAGEVPFYLKLKELTVLGYYTSEIGSTQEMVYLPVPGRYDGDFELAEIGRQWTT